MNQHFVVSRSCLLSGIYQLIQQAVAKTQRFDYCKVFTLTLHFGNVSQRFRDLVHIVMSKVFEGKTITEKDFRSPFIKRFLTRGSVLIRSPTKSSFHTFSDPYSNVKFTDSNASKLRCYSRFRRFWNSNIGESIQHNLLRHLEVAPCLLGHSCYFSAQFSPLLSLKIYGFKNERFGVVSLNIQELTNLTCFEIRVPHSTTRTVTGLSHLSLLQVIVIGGVTSCEGLHPLAKLQRAEYIRIQQNSLELLFKNPDNYQVCELSLADIDLPASLEWVNSCILTKFTIRLNSNDDKRPLFSTNDFPLLKELSVKVESDSDVTLHFSSTILHLEQFSLQSINNSKVNLRIESYSLIQNLQLTGVGPRECCQCLQICSYLKNLSLDNINFIVEESTGYFELKYLEELSISKIVGLFTNFPRCPKLSALKLIRVKDFYFDYIPVFFPRLKDVYLNYSVVQGATKPNTTVQFVTIYHCELFNSRIISQFSKLKLLKVAHVDYHTSFDLQVPGSLLNLHCNGSFPTVCDFLNGVDPSCSISLDIHTTRREEKVEAWLSSFRSQHPRLIRLNH
ncbi:hypothetical protein RCL1_008945 [Eukaryota sp. TZLM3-RCL]